MPIVGVSPVPAISREAVTLQLPIVRPACPPWCAQCWADGFERTHTRPMGAVPAGTDLAHENRPVQVSIEQYDTQAATVYVQLGVDDGAYMTPQAAAVLAAHLLAAAHILAGAR